MVVFYGAMPMEIVMVIGNGYKTDNDNARPMTMVATWCPAAHHVWMELQGGALRVRLIIVICNNLILYYKAS